AARPSDGDAVAARLDALLAEARRESLVESHSLVTTTMPMRTITAPPTTPQWKIHSWSALVVALAMLCVGSVAWLVWPDPPAPPELAAVVPLPAPPPALATPEPPVPRDMPPVEEVA